MHVRLAVLVGLSKPLEHQIDSNWSKPRKSKHEESLAPFGEKIFFFQNAPSMASSLYISLDIGSVTRRCFYPLSNYLNCIGESRFFFCSCKASFISSVR